MLPLSISPVQDQVLAALSSGASISEAADEAKIHRNTIGNWRRSSTEFRSAFIHAVYDRALLFREEAEQLAGRAFLTIRQILEDPKVAPSVRLKAALAILNQATAPMPEPPASQPQPPTLVHDPEIVHNHAQLNPTQQQRTEPRVGRNQSCPCGSGRKFKICCLNKLKGLANSSSPAPASPHPSDSQPPSAAPHR
jgi:transposase-like protein